MELRTRRLLLRELVLADAEASHRYESDPEVVRFQSHGVRTLDESRGYIREGLARVSEKPRRIFDLAVTLERTFIGRAGLAVKDPESKQGALWWVIDPAHQGKGYATEAAAALMAFGFEYAGLHRIYIDVDPANLSSIRVGEKLGMRSEAHFRENSFLKGEWVDSIIMAILDREWTERGASPR